MFSGPLAAKELIVVVVATEEGEETDRIMIVNTGIDMATMPAANMKADTLVSVGLQCEARELRKFPSTPS